MLAQSTINQAIVLLFLLIFCVGVVTLLFSACRVVRRVYRELQR